ncbi:MAG TPA: FtsX-like permease family protein [Vicinamibacterales bacterium]|nr:FtsX-like permease family protein [Vicinamibacterales bacterium]
MTQPFEVHIALRYLFARRKQAFISVISLVSTLGVIVGVMALVLALALMTGMQRELRNRILGATAHLFVWKHGGISDYQAEAAKLRTVPGVTGAAPAVIGKALISSGRGEAFITLKGIDPTLERGVTDIAGAMKSGTLDALAADPEDGPPGIVIGADLAQTLGVIEGDEVTVLTPQGNLTPMGVYPRSRRVRVVGRFSLGLYEFDSAYGLVSLPLARRMLDRTEVDVIELRIDDIYRAGAVSAAIPAALGNAYFSQTWAELNRALFQALWLEKMAISITIGLIVMVAALNIVASLVLLVMEKSPDIAILKTMGAPSRSIMAVFMLQGLVIGAVGTFIGASMGYAVATVLDRYQLIRVPMDVYQIAYVPFVIEGADLAVVVGMALVICFVATIYPSRQAARLDPVDALRFG